MIPTSFHRTSPFRSLNASPYDKEPDETDALQAPRNAQNNSAQSVLLERQDRPGRREPPLKKYFPRRRISPRLGKFVIITNIASLVLLLAALSVVSFLWFGGDENARWRRIMIGDWIGQAVTISSLALRLAIVTQAGAAVSMLASISIEADKGALLQEVPALSIAQYTNTGPVMSALPFLRNRNTPVCIFISLLAFTTSVSQFTSTILLWDVGFANVLGFPVQHELATGIGFRDYMDNFYRLLMLSPNYFQSSITSFPTFAEWSEDPEPMPEQVLDTGPTIRAFLPISTEQDRTSIMDFQGTASLFDSRVVCVRPKITDWNFTTGGRDDNGNYIPYKFKGRVLPETLPDQIAAVLRFNGFGDPDWTGTPFECTMDDFVSLGSGRAFKACVLDYGAGGLINRLDPTQNGTLNYSMEFVISTLWGASANTSDEAWPIELGHAVLFFDAVAPADAIGQSLNLGELTEVYPDFVAKERGVWLDITSASRPNGTSVSVTACYDAYYKQVFYNRLTHVQEFNISASSDSNHTEPNILWDSVAREFDTRPLRDQLGASSSARTLSERGILSLNITNVDAAIRNYTSEFSPTASWSAGPTTFEVTSFRVWGFNSSMPTPSYSFVNDLLWNPQGADNRQLEITVSCQNCTHDEKQQIPHNLSVVTLPPVLGSLVADIVAETGNPALAWQALLTSTTRAAYYDWLPTFTAKSNISTTSMVYCQVPRHSRGFFIVVADMAVHLILVAGTLIWFGKATCTTMISDAWHVVGHFKSRGVDEMLEEVTVVDDSNVKKVIKNSEVLRRRRLRSVE